MLNIFECILTVKCVYVSFFVYLQQDLKPGNLAVNQNCELKVIIKKKKKKIQNNKYNKYRKSISRKSRGSMA